MAKSSIKQLVVCVSNTGYPASLESRKIYVALRDDAAEKLGLLRIVDESGGDYLFPKAFFRAIALPNVTPRMTLLLGYGFAGGVAGLPIAAMSGSKMWR